MVYQPSPWGQNSNFSSQPHPIILEFAGSVDEFIVDWPLVEYYRRGLFLDESGRGTRRLNFHVRLLVSLPDRLDFDLVVHCGGCRNCRRNCAPEMGFPETVEQHLPTVGLALLRSVMEKRSPTTLAVQRHDPGRILRHARKTGLARVSSHDLGHDPFELRRINGAIRVDSKTPRVIHVLAVH